MHMLSCVRLFVTPIDCNLPGYSVYEFLQAKILEWGAISYSRGSSWPRDWTHSSCVSCIGRQILYHCATLENGPAKKKHNIACQEGSEKRGLGGAIGFWRSREAWGWSSWRHLLSGGSRHGLYRSWVVLLPLIENQWSFFTLISSEKPYWVIISHALIVMGSLWTSVYPWCFSSSLLTIISMSIILHIQVLEVLL